MMANKGRAEIKTPKGLTLINQAVAEGRDFIDPSWVAERARISKQAANDILGRLVRSGFLERVSHGKYALRPLGVLGIPVATDDIAVAVAALFEGVAHRIAYRSALDYYDFLVRPVRTIQVASAVRIRQKSLSNRPLQVLLESDKTVHVGAVSIRHGAYVSNVERALLDAGSRPDLVGGVDTLVEALALAPETIRPSRLRAYAAQLNAQRGLRRLGSLLDQLGRRKLADALFRPGFRHLIDLDPKAESEVEFVDDRWRVRWNVNREALLSAATE